MKNNLIKYGVIVLLGSLLFLPFLGQVHLFDWDEINFAEAAREMVLTKEYMRVQIDFQPFWEKPPFFIWMQAWSMRLFGVSAFAARFPNALVGVVTLCTLFYVGRRVISERVGWLWVLFYAGSWLPHFYFKTAIIDPTFNYFILLAFFQVYLIRHGNHSLRHAVLGGFFLGLAVLTKGPVALLVALLSLAVYILISRGRSRYRQVAPFLILALCCFLTVSLWFVPDIIQNGWWFTRSFITYQIRLLTTPDAGHGGPFFYHWVVLLAGCFPASVFFLQRRDRKKHFVVRSENDFSLWMSILFWVVLLLFSIVRTKIVHYSSLCYFPLTFLAALHASRYDSYSPVWKRAIRIAMLVIGCLWAAVLILLPIVGKHVEWLIPLLHDDFAVANLQASVSWDYYAASLGVLYLAGVVAVFLMSRRFFEKSLLLLFVLQMFTIMVTMWYYTPKIEAYSQRAAIEFYERFQGKDVYLVPVGFKSYAHLFYARKPDKNSPVYETSGNRLQWLMTGSVEKPVFFIAKINDTELLDRQSNLKKLYANNGFVFYKRVD